MDKTISILINITVKLIQKEIVYLTSSFDLLYVAKMY